MKHKKEEMSKKKHKKEEMHEMHGKEMAHKAKIGKQKSK
jgi:hypothetical protein